MEISSMVYTAIRRPPRFFLSNIYTRFKVEGRRVSRGIRAATIYDGLLAPTQWGLLSNVRLYLIIFISM